MLHHGNIAFFRLLREHPCRLVDQHDLLIFIENIQLCPGMYGSFFLLQMLSGLFKERTLHKYYLCIVKGVIKEEQDVRGWLLKNEKTNQVRIFKNETKDARPIHTKYRPLADNGQETLLEIELLTGRTHQIRAHLSYMGHPIFGDPKYGDAVLNKKLTSGYGLHMQLLHAWHLVFPELSGDFEGLSGKSIYAPAPKQFVSIAQKRGLGTWEHGIPEV